MNVAKNIKYTLICFRSISRYIFYGIPVVKSYDITYKCNLNCSHCYFYKNHRKIDIDPISDEEWELNFKKEKEAGVYEVYITGGEPMLRPKVIEYASEIFGTGHVHIVTNGTIKIPSHWRNNIYVSIDGDEDTQKEIRGGNILNTIINNIKDNKRVIVTATISNLNYKKIKDIYNISKTANIKGIMFSFYTGKGPDDAIDGKILDEAIVSIKKLKKEDPGFVMVSDKMLEILKSKKHVRKCVLRSDLVVSHLPNMEIKKPCIFGEDIDCNNCGCHIPIMMESLKSLDIETFRMMMKVFT